MDLNQAIILLWYGSTLLLAVLGLKLLVTGALRRSYPAFTLYIIALFAESVLLAFFNRRRAVYGQVWLATRAVIIPLQFLVVFQIFKRWTGTFKGIGAFGRRLRVVLMAISMVIAVATSPIAWKTTGFEVAFQLMAVVSRGVNLFCSLFLLLTLWFFYKFGGPVPTNLKRHTWAMEAYVSANALSYLMMSWHAFITANVMLPVVSVSSLVFWIVALRPSGEAQPLSAFNAEEWAETEEMNRQLQKLADSVTLSPHGLKKKR